uniref:Uncharacterized protein n=1 Tax=Myoviridae sp. ctakU3 TaxID=2825135 RepID=A0A8S5P1W1_9CAUD|nr:MAG TPA: hypothetical protein [Myoviridae sp. ctakU3]
MIAPYGAFVMPETIEKVMVRGIIYQSIAKV